MSTEITHEELEAHYFDFMRRVCLGESFTILLDGSPAAILRPTQGAKRKKKAAKILGELSTPRFDGASDEAICEWLGEPPPRAKEEAEGGDAG